MCVCSRMRDGASLTSQMAVVADRSFTSPKFPFTIVKRLGRLLIISGIN